MSASAVIRAEIRRREEFTSDDIYRAVRDRVPESLYVGSWINNAIWQASQRGEIVEVGQKTVDKRRTYKIWRRTHTAAGDAATAEWRG
jgi:hypothetical protein